MWYEIDYFEIKKVYVSGKIGDFLWKCRYVPLLIFIYWNYRLIKKYAKRNTKHNIKSD